MYKIMKQHALGGIRTLIVYDKAQNISKIEVIDRGITILNYAKGLYTEYLWL